MSDRLICGKRLDNGEWVEGHTMIITDIHEERTVYIAQLGTKFTAYMDEHGNIGEIEGFICKVNSDTIGRGTGRTDKNKKNIYEGHIIKATVSFEYIGIVRFGEYAMPDSISKTHLGFYIEWINDEFIRPDFGFWLSKYEKQIEIIGNVHDNPELFSEVNTNE